MDIKYAESEYKHMCPQSLLETVNVILSQLRIKICEHFPQNAVLPMESSCTSRLTGSCLI